MLAKAEISVLLDRVSQHNPDISLPKYLFAILLLGWCALGAPVARAECDCLWQGSFSEVYTRGDAVVLGRVLAHKGNAMDLALEDIWAGHTVSDPIRIWLQARDYCRPPIEQFPLDSRWVLVLKQIQEVPEGGFDPSTPNISYGRPYDYTLSRCGGYFLQVQGQTLRGNLTPDMPRFAHEPTMTPVLVPLVKAYVDGQAALADLQAASRKDPALQALQLDTRSFLRDQADYVEPTATPPNE
jgi:hypothetical protein